VDVGRRIDIDGVSRGERRIDVGRFLVQQTTRRMLPFNKSRTWLYLHLDFLGTKARCEDFYIESEIVAL